MLPEAAINDIYLAPLLQCLMEGLSAEPRVASNVCWVRGSCYIYEHRHAYLQIYMHTRMYTRMPKGVSEVIRGLVIPHAQLVNSAVTSGLFCGSDRKE